MWLIGTNNLSREQIYYMLGMGIPALTPSIGRVPIRDVIIPAERQIIMNVSLSSGVDFKPNGWPNRGTPYYTKWLHNDMINMAYFYNYKLFDSIADTGEVK